MYSRRKELGWTVELAAEVCQVNPRTISELERGVRQTGFGTVAAYAQNRLPQDSPRGEERVASPDDLTEAIRHAGFPERLALGEFESIRDDALHALPRAFDLVGATGYAEEVERLAPPMEKGLRNRANFSYTEVSAYVDAKAVGTGIRK